jgi:hypothetical protein
MMNEIPAGTGPAEEFDVVEEVAVPSVTMLRAELAHAQRIVASVADKIVSGDVHFEGASGSAAKLMAASALAASAIAKIVDAETRQRLASERIRFGYFPPRYRPEPRRAHDGDDRR